MKSVKAEAVRDPFGTSGTDSAVAVTVPVPVQAEAVPVQVPARGNLAELRERLSILQGQREHLRAELAHSEEKQQDLAKELAALKSGLTEGGSAEEIPVVAAKLEGRKVAALAVQEALGKVEAEAARIAARVQGIEHRNEIQRQNEAAAPLKEKREAVIAGFIAGLAGLLEPLRDVDSIDVTLRTQFPLAEAPKALSIDDLATRTLKAWSESGRFVESAAGFWQVEAFRKYIAAVLRGPFPGAGEGEVLLRRLGGR